MAYDEKLAARIRELFFLERSVQETKMFGGLAFLINGNMSFAASGQGGVLLRVDPEEMTALAARRHARPMMMGGRAMKGWLRVDAAGVATKKQLESWVKRGIAYAKTLPPKR